MGVVATVAVPSAARATLAPPSRQANVKSSMYTAVLLAMEALIDRFMRGTLQSRRPPCVSARAGRRRAREPPEKRSPAGGPHGLEALDLRQDDLAHAHAGRGGLDRLVLPDPLQRLFEGQLAVGVEADQHVGGRRAHVGEVLLL